MTNEDLGWFLIIVAYRVWQILPYVLGGMVGGLVVWSVLRWGRR